MVYEELMMDASTLLKFELFRKMMFIGRPNYSIAELAQEMNLNYQQTVIDLTEIDKEISEIRPEHESFLIGAGKINCLNLTATIDEYRYYLLQNSVPFQFILYFINEENPTIEDFCDRYFSSRSTVSRKIEKLKNFLKSFNLRFTYTEAGIVGDERLARLALFNLIWLGTRGIVWPFQVSEDKVNQMVAAFGEYFPLSRTYLGSLELKYFAAIFLLRIKKGIFVKYDKAYDCLMKNNDYYDFTRLNPLVDNQLTARQSKAESSFIFFLAHFIPFYTLEDDPTLAQTIHDFKKEPNPVDNLVEEFLHFAKEELFTNNPSILDQPLVIGNLLNITFGYYVIKYRMPTIQRLLGPKQVFESPIREMEGKIRTFFVDKSNKEPYDAFVNNATINSLVNGFTQVLMPLYDTMTHAKKVEVGVAIEHNYLIVKSIYQFMSDLKFVNAETFATQKQDHYDLIISSSLLIKNQTPNSNFFLWELGQDDEQYIILYKRLRKIFNEKNK